MKPNSHLRRLLKVNISSDSSYSEIEIGLSNLKRIVRSTSRKDVARGAIKKMLSLFYFSGKTAKGLALSYLSRVSKYVEEVDTNILHMFYSTDEKINSMGVRFVWIFSRFFRNNDVIFYHIYRSKSRHREKAMRSLISCSERYHTYGREMLVSDDLDLFGNLETNTPEEYFGRLSLPKLVELASVYPCLIKYFKFTSKFLVGEACKADRYDAAVLDRLERILSISRKEDTKWNTFLCCLKRLKHGNLDKALAILKDLCKLEISRKYKIIFSVFIRQLSEHLGMKDMDNYMIHDINGKVSRFSVSASFEAKLCGLAQNKVYKVLKKLLKVGLEHSSLVSVELGVEN